MPSRSPLLATVAHTLRTGLLVTVACMGLATSVSAFDHEGLARRALKHHIVPGYRRFSEAAAEQAKAVAAACEQPGPEGLAAARRAFTQALLAWGRIEHIHFGPIADHNRRSSLIFWPDPRGIGRRQIARALTQQDGGVLLSDTLAGKSVAIQGFSTLDVLLFAPGSEALAQSGAAARFRCGFARALATNIDTTARQTLTAWTDPAAFVGLWLAPGAGNPSFLTANETTHALAQAYLTGIEQVRNVRLGGPLGLKERGIRPLEPIMPNSKQALDLLIANIEGLRALLLESGLAEPTHPGAPAHSVMQSVVTELEMTIPRIRAAATMSPTPFQDPAARSHLVLLGFPLKNAHDTAAASLAKEADLSMGFNALDGD